MQRVKEMKGNLVHSRRRKKEVEERSGKAVVHQWKVLQGCWSRDGGEEVIMRRCWGKKRKKSRHTKGTLETDNKESDIQ